MEAPRSVSDSHSTRRSRVKRACVNCKAAKSSCESSRPCRRCVRLGLESSCVDSVPGRPGRKPRVGAGIVDGKYLKDRARKGGFRTGRSPLEAEGSLVEKSLRPTYGSPIFANDPFDDRGKSGTMFSEKEVSDNARDSRSSENSSPHETPVLPPIKVEPGRSFDEMLDNWINKSVVNHLCVDSKHGFQFDSPNRIFAIVLEYLKKIRPKDADASALIPFMWQCQLLFAAVRQRCDDGRLVQQIESLMDGMPRTTTSPSTKLAVSKHEFELRTGMIRLAMHDAPLGIITYQFSEFGEPSNIYNNMAANELFGYLDEEFVDIFMRAGPATVAEIYDPNDWEKALKVTLTAISEQAPMYSFTIRFKAKNGGMFEAVQTCSNVYHENGAPALTVMYVIPMDIKGTTKENSGPLFRSGCPTCVHGCSCGNVRSISSKHHGRAERFSSSDGEVSGSSKSSEEERRAPRSPLHSLASIASSFSPDSSPFAPQ